MDRRRLLPGHTHEEKVKRAAESILEDCPDKDSVLRAIGRIREATA